MQSLVNAMQKKKNTNHIPGQSKGWVYVNLHIFFVV